MSEPVTITEAVKTIEDLPTLPAVVQKLLVMLRDPNYSAADVSGAICSDQALAARVLKLVNSPAYGIEHDIQSIDRAVIILGSDALQNLVMCAGVTAAMEAMGNPAVLTHFWRHGYFVGAGAQALAVKVAGVDPGAAFLAGLVHDLGDLVLAMLRPEEWKRARHLGSHERLAAEKRYIGLTHQRAGHMLATRWCLPDDITETIREHHSQRASSSNERPVLTIVTLADGLSRLAGAGSEPPLAERWLVSLMRTVGFEVGGLAAYLHELDRLLAARSAFLDLDHAATLRPDFTRDGIPPRVTIFGASQNRLLWLQQIMQYHGFEVVPIRTFLTTVEDVDLVLLDPGSLGRAQVQKCRPFLARSQAVIAACGEHPRDIVEEELGTNLPHLELLFSPQELAAVMALRRVPQA